MMSVGLLKMWKRVGKALPGMADTNDMVNIAEGELEELVGEDTAGVCKAEQGVIGKHCP